MQFFRKLFLTFLILVLAGNSTFAVFADVKNDEIAPEVIEFLRASGIGEATENFYPKRPISLAEFLAMGLTAAGITEEDLTKNSTSRFSDVPSEIWFAPFIAEAEKLNLLEGFRGENLLPNRPVNRGEAAQLGLGIFGIGVPVKLSEEEFGFRDVGQKHRLARFIFRAVKMGVINPETDDEFGVTRRMNRAEAAEFFYNLANFKEGGETTIIINNGLSQIPNWQLFETIWKEAKNKFLFKENLNDGKMLNSALAGLVDSLGDPYSEFYTPEQTQLQTSNLSGEIEGIGVFIEKDLEDRGLLIVAPIFSSPADRVGLRAGDIITAVDDKSLVGLPLEDAANLTRGPSGTTARYRILRDGQKFVVEIIREKIKIDSVSLEFKDNIAVVDLNQFTAALPEDFAEITEKIKKQHPRGIILDLRNNGGGLVNSAVDLLGYFLPEGAIVASQEFREGLENRNLDYRTERKPTLQGFRTLVLVNKGSASASEIVAAALQDHNVASVVGEQTFGKGTVQEISFFENGTALKLTVAHWLSPRKQPIQDFGVTPDFEAVDNPETPMDEALNRTLELF
ncbi:S-layer homology domain-containing protein [Candidatus Gracilibacteria bacterium]|nr:S-layer homology domain-containing protein [Candidatus Gracilibacteria bacterium]MCF7856236.1 S-layer homology domain-containing protein [Candidatus Gracilibacteria bacterium]MCF7896699.1 S-layer homology domain-containing protein [Candidatus Gracilibacteria bacterium]